MTRYQKMAGKYVRHHQERHPHEGPDKRSRAAEALVPQQYTPQHVREDAGRGDVPFDGRAGSARTDPMEIGAVGNGKKGTGKKGKGKNDQKGRGKGPGPRTPTQIESAFTVTTRETSKRSAEFVSPTTKTASPRTRKTRERTNDSGKRKRNE